MTYSSAHIKNRNIAIVITLAIIYLILALFLVVASISGHSMIAGVVPLGGIITAIQFLLAISMTMANYDKGGKTASVLLILSFISAMRGLLITHDFSAVPGCLYDVAIFVSVQLIIHGLKRQVELSTTDELTGISNRRNILNAIDYLTKQKTPFTLLYLDIDHFKVINDTEGHNNGDVIIKTIVDTWKECVPEEALLGRIGGDEFLCLVPKMHIGDAKVLAVKMQNALIELCGEEAKIKYHLTASVGIAAYPDDTADGSEMVQKADLALFAAKQEGKGSIARYEASNDEIVVRDERIEEAIRNALENDKFYMVYQPQFFSNKKLRGFESLIRMDNEGGELIGPADFIPVAEKSDLILEIGKFVIRKVMTDFADIVRDNKQLIISVNISAKQILSPGFSEYIRQMLNETGFSAKNLEIEITEYCMVDESDEVVNIINDIKSTGITLAMDDFGTGYSSLAYLTRLPIDLIKIDKSLIDTMNEGEIVNAIVSMGHTLGCNIISEGVEDEHQLEILKDIGCDMIQGYIWGKPIALEDARALACE